MVWGIYVGTESYEIIDGLNDGISDGLNLLRK